MKTVNRIVCAACMLLPVAPELAAQPRETSAEFSQVQKAVVSAQVSNRSPAAPLEMRVSVQYVNSKAADILAMLAKAAGLTVEVGAASLQPVTLTLTNVRLRTALDAICDTASCAWRLDGTVIKVTSTGSSSSGALPPTVSLALDQVAAPDVFKALGAALEVPVIIEGHLARPPVTVKFTNMNTSTALDFLCKTAGCSWEFDTASRQLRVKFKAP